MVYFINKKTVFLHELVLKFGGPEVCVKSDHDYILTDLNTG
jgi:hypothetical protein